MEHQVKTRGEWIDEKQLNMKLVGETKTKLLGQG